MAEAVASRPGTDVAIDSVEVGTYEIPTDRPESDGTLEWDSTTMVTVEVHAGDATGLGYTYGDGAVAKLVESKLAGVVEGRDAMAIPAAWEAMVEAIRNLGRPGICSMAIAAVDIALWDLKARLLDAPLVTLLGAAHDAVPIYGSGGFTSYSLDELQLQLGGWVEQGMRAVKMKVGREPLKDPRRVAAAREAVGSAAELFVDANGAYSRKQALELAEAFAAHRVSWFEEPVTSDDLDGLRIIRDRAPAVMDIAAGEYGYDVPYFEHMLSAGAVDVLQADVTRCAGITELLRVGALCRARSVPFSGHTAPALHVHPLCAIQQLAHLEYFHDHARIESMLLDGVPEPDRGVLRPDLSRPGHGLELRRADAERFAA
jgi:L-alanine-DL-glutamate epimerase-like enolase superfamily enzyme